MQFAKKGTPINDWYENVVPQDRAVEKLAGDNKLHKATIYTYINSRRDIRVLNGKIFEIKQLGGKS